MIWLIRLLTLLLLCCSSAAAAELDQLRIRFIDVGQGDAMLVHQPGSCALLIDAGLREQAGRILENLEELGITELDLALVTHPHRDHFGGLLEIASQLSIGRLLDNGDVNPADELFADYLDLREQLPYEQLQAGRRLSCGGLEIEVLYPAEIAAPGTDLNANSLALLLRYGQFRLLHLGDLAGPGEHRLLAGNAAVAAEVVKLAHHGAGDATSSRLIGTVRPRQAVISVAAENHLRAPAPRVLELLRQHRIQLFRTDLHGTIELLTTGSSYHLAGNRGHSIGDNQPGLSKD